MTNNIIQQDHTDDQQPRFDHLPNCRRRKYLAIWSRWQYDDGRNDNDQIYNEEATRSVLHFQSSYIGCQWTERT